MQLRQDSPIEMTITPRGSNYVKMITMVNDIPDWLKRITYGLVGHGSKCVVLAEGKTNAIVKSPGSFWSDNSGRHYGEVQFLLVEKNAREGIGLIEGKTLQSGGRANKAKLTEWRKLVI